MKLSLINQNQLKNSSLIYYNKNTLSIEYSGCSPIGRLIILSLINNNNNNINNNNNKLKFNIKSRIFPTIELTINQLNQSYFFEQCITCYFDHYSPFCPIIDELLFRNDPKPHPLVFKTIVAIGYRYIAYGLPQANLSKKLDQMVLEEYNYYKWKPTVELIAVSTLIAQYQTFNQIFEKTWLLQSTTSQLCKMLGVGMRPPISLKWSDRKLRNRYNQWCACSIQDKLFACALNRPMAMAVGSWIQPSPNFPPLGPIDEYPDAYQRREITERASFIFWRGLYLVCEMMGTVLQSQRSIHRHHNDPTKFHTGLLQFLKCFERFDVNHRKTMGILSQGKPKWVHKICEKFLGYHTIYLNNLIVESCELYLNHPMAFKQVNESKAIQERMLDSCCIIIEAAESLGENYLRYGMIFRIYCVSHAILLLSKHLVNLLGEPIRYNIYHAFKTGNINGLCYKGVKVVKGLKLLYDTIPYFEIAKEFFGAVIRFLGIEEEEEDTK